MYTEELVRLRKYLRLDNKINIDYANNKMNINSYDERSISRIYF